MALNANASNKAKLQGKPSNANDMQAIKQGRSGKWCETRETRQKHGKRCKAQKTMQRGLWKTMWGAKNDAKCGKRGESAGNGAKHEKWGESEAQNQNKAVGNMHRGCSKPKKQ